MENPLAPDKYAKRTRSRKSDVRGPYFRDQTAIIHSMPYRRLKHKTQVFFSPQNDHVCTRIEHVQHVATIAAAICGGLNAAGWKLDTEMAYAIGLGHDIGHAPFGHAGEKALTDCLGKDFVHEVNSYRVVQYVANNGEGLNLTYGVKDGIICHNGERFEIALRPIPRVKNLDAIRDRSSAPSSYEGCIVRFSDKIAYLGRDIEDAVLAGLIRPNDVPKSVRRALGQKNGEIINTLVNDVVRASRDGDEIRFSQARYDLLTELKDFNYRRIYGHKVLEDYKFFVDRIIRSLYLYLVGLFEEHGLSHRAYARERTSLGRAFGHYIGKMSHLYGSKRVTAKTILEDYISGMTDQYAIRCMQEISLPQPISFD